MTQKSITKWVPIRAVIWIMCLTCTLFVYMLRINLSIIILAMVQPITKGNKTSGPECTIIKHNTSNIVTEVLHLDAQDYGSRYEWSNELQGVVLGSYFWGSTLSGIPGGALAEKFGPSKCITISFLMSGLLTLVAPWAASLHPIVLIITRFLIGIFAGVVFPSLHCLIARWAPPDEKGKFIGALLGSSLGTVITWPLLGAIIEKFGWIFAFLGCGIIVIAWTVLWFLCVTDFPEQHRRISEEEKNYIVESLSGTISKVKVKTVPVVHNAALEYTYRKNMTEYLQEMTESHNQGYNRLKLILFQHKHSYVLYRILYSPSNGDTFKYTRLPPYKEIAQTIPFWALMILHFGTAWGLFFIMVAAPKYFSSVLGFTLGHAGILASLPSLMRLIVGILCGQLGDFVTRKDWMTKTTIRKSFVLFSHFLPGIFLFAQTLTGCDVTWAVVLITISLGLNGASTLTNLQNAQDLSPNFAGTLFGIINCIGNTSGFINPTVVGYLTAKRNGLEEWHIIFYIGSSVYIASGIIFCIFGTGEIQPWNEKTTDGNELEITEFEDKKITRDSDNDNKTIAK